MDDDFSRKFEMLKDALEKKGELEKRVHFFERQLQEASGKGSLLDGMAALKSAIASNSSSLAGFEKELASLRERTDKAFGSSQNDFSVRLASLESRLNKGNMLQSMGQAGPREAEKKVELVKASLHNAYDEFAKLKEDMDAFKADVRKELDGIRKAAHVDRNAVQSIAKASAAVIARPEFQDFGYEEIDIPLRQDFEKAVHDRQSQQPDGSMTGKLGIMRKLLKKRFSWSDRLQGIAVQALEKANSAKAKRVAIVSMAHVLRDFLEIKLDAEGELTYAELASLAENSDLDRDVKSACREFLMMMDKDEYSDTLDGLNQDEVHSLVKGIIDAVCAKPLYIELGKRKEAAERPTGSA